MAPGPPSAKAPRFEFLRGQALALGGAFLFAGLVGSIIIAVYGENPLGIYATVWEFSTRRLSDVGRVLTNATPLIFSGLAVAVAFKAGLFNIGVEGQYKVGMAAATAVAVSVDLPAFLLVPLVVLAAMAASTAWAAIPAVLRVKTGAHEVVTTIMMNLIAVSLVAWALLNPLRTSEQGLIDLRSDVFPEAARIPLLGPSLGLDIPRSVNLSWLFVVAILACVVVWILLYRSRLGFEVRAVGASAGSAEAGGVSIGATQIKVFLISGALAGLVGLNHLLADKGFLGVNYQSGLGFEGIAVAFLGRNHPFGILLSAILIGVITRGQDGVAVTSSLPTEILIILQGVLILSVVIAYELVNRALRRRQLHAAEASPVEPVPEGAA
ncbi:MAG TPA: ABC transporter permease [Actinomycetota bacterium]|jgi:simple sugar transport system permease protein